MRVIEFRELGEGFYDLVGTLTAGSDDHDVSLGLLTDSVLQHGLTCTERTVNESCTSLANRVSRIDGTYTGLQQFERTRFALVSSDGFLHRPLLHHCNLLLIAVGIGQHGYRVVDGVLSFFDNRLNRIFAFEHERHHDLVRLVVLVHLTQPSRSLNLIANLGERLECPLLVLVQRETVLTALEEHTGQFVQVVLQTVVVTAQQTRSESHLQHVTGELYRVTNFQTTC